MKSDRLEVAIAMYGSFADFPGFKFKRLTPQELGAMDGVSLQVMCRQIYEKQSDRQKRKYNLQIGMIRENV